MTEMYDSVLLMWPSRVELDRTWSLPLATALELMHKSLQKNPEHLAGFKKQRQDVDLQDHPENAFMCDREETNRYRNSLDRLLEVFAPMGRVYNQEERNDQCQTNKKI